MDGYAQYESEEHGVRVLYGDRCHPHGLEYGDYMALERGLEEAWPERKDAIHARLVDDAEVDPPHPEDAACLYDWALWALCRHGRRDAIGEITGVPGGWVSFDGVVNTVIPPTADNRCVDWSVLPAMAKAVGKAGWPMFRAWYALEEPDGPHGFLIVRAER